MKKYLCLFCALLLWFAADGARAADRYENRIEAGGGAFFAYVKGDTKTVTRDFGGALIYFDNAFTDAVSLPLLVYVDGSGAETRVGYYKVYAEIADGIVAEEVAPGGEQNYHIVNNAGEMMGETFASGTVFRYGHSEVRGLNGKDGIIDERGVYLIEPTYESISHASSDELAGYERAPYACYDGAGNLTVLDAETLNVIGRYENADRHLSDTYENPAVFIVESWSARRVCSMQTGEVLWTLAVDELEHEFGAGNKYTHISIEGGYGAFIEGLPQRLIVAVGEGSERLSYMADNEGRRVTGDCQDLEALVWNGDDGVFLVGSYEKAAYEAFLKSQENWAEEDFEDEKNYTPEKKYGGTYRCGLIDADGEALTERIYTGVKALSPTRFILTRPDGMSEPFTVPEKDGSAAQRRVLSRARRVESYLEGSFATTEVPALFADELGADYDLIARADQEGRPYVLAARKADAAPLPANVRHVSAGGDFDSDECTFWQLGGRSGGPRYSFRQLTNTAIHGYDGYDTLLILPDSQNRPKTAPQVENIGEAMTAGGRALIEYRREHGFVAGDENRWQIRVHIERKNLYVSGALAAPRVFSIDLDGDTADIPRRVAASKVSKGRVKGKKLYDNGVWLSKNGEDYMLLENQKGEKGYFQYTSDSGKISYCYNPKAWKAVMKAVKAHTGKPFEVPAANNLYSATLEWPVNRFSEWADGPLQFQTVKGKKKLNQIKKMLGNAQVSGASACPFCAFLTLRYKGGRATVTVALATDSCNMAATEGGLSFEYGLSQKKLLELFDEIKPN